MKHRYVIYGLIAAVAMIVAACSNSDVAATVNGTEITEQDNLDGTIGIGNTYATESPWGFDGGFWYLRLRADFE